MALPNLGMVFTPFDPLPASDVNDIVENVEALAAGTGLNDASVTAEKTAFGGDYSTSEVDTGFKWVDNKTIFKKTISTGALPNSTSKSVAHGISTFDFAIHTYGHAKNSGGVIRPLPYPGTSTNYVGISVDATNVTLSTSSDLTTYSVSYVTLIYVKT